MSALLDVLLDFEVAYLKTTCLDFLGVHLDGHPLRFYKVSGRFQKFPLSLSLPLQLKRIGALAEMLDFRDQFHCFFTEADAELLWSVGMLVLTIAACL